MYNELYRVTKANLIKLNLNSSTDKVTYSNRVAYNILEKTFDKSCNNLVANNLRSLIFTDMNKLCSETIDEIDKEAEIEVDKQNLIEDVLSAVILGTIYNTNWTLSNAVYKIIDSNEELIESIIEEGIANGKTPEEIAEDILNVLDPNPNVEKRSYTIGHKTIYVGKPTYPAFRLSRTVLQHTYQTVVIGMSRMINMMTDKKVMIRWISALEENTCQVCESRHMNLYTPDDLPLEHPNGQCSFEIEIYD